jgi:hypothetical protein
LKKAAAAANHAVKRLDDLDRTSAGLPTIDEAIDNFSLYSTVFSEAWTFRRTP